MNSQMPPITLPPIALTSPKAIIIRPNAPPDGRRDPGRPDDIALPAPERGAQHTPAIERECRHQIEQGQDGVDVGQIIGDRHRRRRGFHAAVKAGQNPERERHEQAHDRPGDRHQQFTDGAGRFLLHLGDAAEDEQRDAADRHVEAPGDQGMGQLVHDDREAQADQAGHPHPPIGRGRIIGQHLWEIGRRQGPHDQYRQQQPAGVDMDLEPEQLEQRYPMGQHFSASLDIVASPITRSSQREPSHRVYHASRPAKPLMT